MRRWLTILLLVMLPLQFSWAAAAAYCQHETSADAGHVGHHQHEHKASTQGADDGSKLLGDNDCGYCHLSAAKPVQMQAAEVPVTTGPTIRGVAAGPLPSRDPDRLERPNWCLA